MRIHITICVLMVLSLGMAARSETSAELQQKLQAQLRQYTSAADEKKTKAGQKTIALLMELSGVQALEGKADSAKLSLDQAQIIAKNIRDQELTKNISQQKIRNAQLKGIGIRLRQYEKLIRMYPKNAKARAGLVKLYLLELDEPHNAQKYLTSALPEDIRTYALLAVENPYKLQPTILIELACWYAAQGEKLSPEIKHQNLVKAKYLLTVAKENGQKFSPATASQYNKLQARLKKEKITLPRELKLDITANSPKLTRCIQKARQFLLGMQKPDGAWPTYSVAGEETRANWPTALATTGLLCSGYPPKNKAIAKSVKFLDSIQPDDSFAIAIRCLMLAQLKPRPGSAEFANLETLCKKLIFSRPEKDDAMTVHFSTITLHKAANIGVTVPRSYWLKVLDYWRKRKNSDGGFGFALNEPSTEISTLAGTNDTIISMIMVGRTREKIFKYAIVENAIEWIDKHFDNRTHSPMYQALLVAELIELRQNSMFGKKDAGQKLMTFLLTSQRPNGSWQRPAKPTHVTTAIGLIAISIYKKTITQSN